MALLRFYLDKLDVRQAESLVFTADGAPWIWERIEPLFANWKIPVYRVLDFYHATWYRVQVTQACKGWSAKQQCHRRTGQGAHGARPCSKSSTISPVTVNISATIA